MRRSRTSDAFLSYETVWPSLATRAPPPWGARTSLGYPIRQLIQTRSPQRLECGGELVCSVREQRWRVSVRQRRLSRVSNARPRHQTALSVRTRRRSVRRRWCTTDRDQAPSVRWQWRHRTAAIDKGRTRGRNGTAARADRVPRRVPATTFTTPWIAASACRTRCCFAALKRRSLVGGWTTKSTRRSRRSRCS